MLDGMKAMGALAGLMKNKDKMEAAGKRVRDKMERTRCTGEAGGGAARAVVTGTMRVETVELSPALVAGLGGMAGIGGDAKTQEMAGMLIAEAVNSALRQAQERMREAVNVEAKELGMEGVVPDLSRLLGQ